MYKMFVLSFFFLLCLSGCAKGKAEEIRVEKTGQLQEEELQDLDHLVRHEPTS